MKDDPWGLRATTRGGRGLAGGLLLLYAAAACSRDSAAPPKAPPPPPQQPQGAVAPVRDSAAFENRVWKVKRSPTVEAGQLYVFLADGTLLIASAHGTPALGKWRLEGEQMTMVEEGIPYRVTILHSSPDSFNIRMANPGEPVDIDFVPASIRSAGEVSP